jgi:putative endonuclease
MGRAKDAVGGYGERVAIAHLIAQGMRLLERNWRCADGELDAILRDGDVLVVVEVKTRRGDGFGTPAEAVGSRKITRVRRLAARWLAEHPVGAAEVRFDVVSVWPQPRGAARIEHLRGAF